MGEKEKEKVQLEQSPNCLSSKFSIAGPLVSSFYAWE